MAVWCIVTLVFTHIFTVFSLPREQFASSPVIFNTPLSTLPTNTFNSQQTNYPSHSALNYNPTFRLNLPGRTRHAEVLRPTNAEFDFTDHVTGYTAPANNYFVSQPAIIDIIDSSEEQQFVTNKRKNANPGTSSVFFRLGNSPITQYRVVHEHPVRQSGNDESKKMLTIEKAKFIGMTRNPPDFNPFAVKRSPVINVSHHQNKNKKYDISANNGESIQAQYIGKTINPPDFNPFAVKQQPVISVSQYQTKNKEYDIPANNGESIEAQYIGKTINPPDFNPFIAKKRASNVPQYQDKNGNPYISDNSGENIQEQYIGKNENPTNFNPHILKPTVSIERNVPLSNTNSQRLRPIADNSNAEIKGISFLDPHMRNYQKLKIKDLVTQKSNIQSTFPALFIQNVKPKIFIQPQNLTQIPNLTLKNSPNSQQQLQGPLINPPQQSQVQLTNPTVQNLPLLHKSSLPYAVQYPNVQNIPTQRNIAPFTNTKPTVERVHPVYIKLTPSTITQTNFQHIPTQKSILPSIFTQPKINNSPIQKYLLPSPITHTNIGRITTQRSILPLTIAQSSGENSSVHKISKGLHENIHISDSEDDELSEEDLIADKSEETSIPGTNFKFDPPITDDTYFYSYDINSTKRPKQFYGRNFGQAEKSENGRTTGRYYVQLPDGRTQVVTYYADHTGYHPTVSYFSKKNIDR